MTQECKTPGCGEVAVSEASPYCVGCQQHRDMLEALNRSRPKPASPHTLGVDRLCGNCLWFVEGDRYWHGGTDDGEWRWRTNTGGHGDCRVNPPRPVDGDRRHFAVVHRDDWCRQHAMRREHHRPGKP